MNDFTESPLMQDFAEELDELLDKYYELGISSYTVREVLGQAHRIVTEMVEDEESTEAAVELLFKQHDEAARKGIDS